jgi:non-specific serine/threonine protein kinase
MEDSMLLFHSLGDRRWEAILFSDLAQVSFSLGDKEDARSRLEKVLPYFRETKDRQHVCFALLRLVQLARLEGHYAIAKEYSVEGLALARELGSKLLISGFTADLGFIAVHDGELDSARSFLVESLVIARELNVRYRTAKALLGFAIVSVTEKQVRHAIPLLAFVDCIFGGKVRGGLSAEDEADYAKSLTNARRQLDEATFRTAWAEGRALTLDQAIACALTESNHESRGNELPRKIKVEFGGLTPRERQVAVLVARGYSNPEIAHALVISERTVTTHVTNIFSKLGFTSRTQIASWATAKGLTSL